MEMPHDLFGNPLGIVMDEPQKSEPGEDDQRPLGPLQEGNGTQPRIASARMASPAFPFSLFTSHGPLCDTP